MAEELDAAVREAIAILSLGISDALGPVRPVSGLAGNERRASKTLLRAMERAYAGLKGIDAQVAYNNIAEYQRPPAPEVVAPLEELVDERDPSVSVRAFSAGLPTLGKR